MKLICTIPVQKQLYHPANGEYCAEVLVQSDYLIEILSQYYLSLSFGTIATQHSEHLLLFFLILLLLVIKSGYVSISQDLRKTLSIYSCTLSSNQYQEMYNLSHSHGLDISILVNKEPAVLLHEAWALASYSPAMPKEGFGDCGTWHYYTPTTRQPLWKRRGKDIYKNLQMP